jgi:hypothetical protein
MCGRGGGQSYCMILGRWNVCGNVSKGFFFPHDEEERMNVRSTSTSLSSLLSPP